MEKKYIFEFTEDDYTLLLMGLRFLELSHPIDNPTNHDYKPEFKKLLDKIYIQLNQLKLL